MSRGSPPDHDVAVEALFLLIPAPQPSPPTNGACQYTHHGFAPDTQSRTSRGRTAQYAAAKALGASPSGKLRFGVSNNWRGQFTGGRVAKFDLKAYARQGAGARVAELNAELAAIYRTFPELRQGAATGNAPSAVDRRKRRGMTAA